MSRHIINSGSMKERPLKLSKGLRAVRTLPRFSWEPHDANITGNGMPPSRADVRTMAAQPLINLFEAWLRDGSNASSPTKEVVSDLLSELEARPDRDAFAGFIVRQKEDFGID